MKSLDLLPFTSCGSKKGKLVKRSRFYWRRQWVRLRYLMRRNPHREVEVDIVVEAEAEAEVEVEDKIIAEKKRRKRRRSINQ